MIGYTFYPHTVVWEITFACNMRCLHCGTAAGKRRPDELTTAEALRLLDDMMDLGAKDITLSGGEPLLRQDWRQLARKVRSRDGNAFLITNGYAITPSTVEEFEEVQFRNIGVSLDGTQKTHDYIRQRENSFERATSALKMMSDNGNVKFCAITQVSNINLNELDDIRQILIDSGCTLWRVQMTTSTGRMKDHSDLVISLDNMPRLVDKLLEYKEGNTIRVDVGENVGYYGCKGTQLWEGEAYTGCFAGTRVCGVESNGDIKGCLSMPEDFVEGNVRDKSFADIWNNPDGFAYNRQFTRETAKGACHDCRYLPLCRGGCATTSFSATGCRADNPFCMYQLEKQQGIEIKDTPHIEKVLKDVYSHLGEEIPGY